MSDSAGSLFVSGVDAGGTSRVVQRADIDWLTEIPGMPMVRFADLFTSNEAPPDLTAALPATGTEGFFIPANGGHVLRLLEFQPDPDGFDISSVRHATETVDHVVVLDGELVCVFDDGEVVLRPGDVLVQRGVQHAWSNRTDKPCRVLAVIIDANRG